MIEEACEILYISGNPIFSVVNDNAYKGYWERTGVAARWTPETGWIYPTRNENE